MRLKMTRVGLPCFDKSTFNMPPPKTPSPKKRNHVVKRNLVELFTKIVATSCIKPLKRKVTMRANEAGNTLFNGA